MDSVAIDQFFTRWPPSGGAERAGYQLFLTELAGLVEVPRPNVTTTDTINLGDGQNACVFERAVRFDNLGGTHSTGRIDLYKRGCFVCETFQNPPGTTQQSLTTSEREPAEPVATATGPAKIKKQPLR